MAKQDKKYGYRNSWSSEVGVFDSIDEMLQEIADNGEDPTDFEFFEMTPGKYVPPSSPATVVFG